MMQHCEGLKCFDNFNRETFESRFYLTLTDEELLAQVDKILKAAMSSYSTSSYDSFQWLTNRIIP